MSQTVDGPSGEAFNNPNALEIGRLQLQINKLAKARDGADGSRKKALIEQQIAQLKAQQTILNDEMVHGHRSHALDWNAITKNLSQQKTVLAPYAEGPTSAERIRELDDVIQAIEGRPTPATSEKR